MERVDLMNNGVGIMSIIDNKFYIEDETWGCYRECTKKEFIEELKKMSWVCLTSWNEEFKNTYLELVNMTNTIKESD